MSPKISVLDLRQYSIYYEAMHHTMYRLYTPMSKLSALISEAEHKHLSEIPAFAIVNCFLENNGTPIQPIEEMAVQNAGNRIFSDIFKVNYPQIIPELTKRASVTPRQFTEETFNEFIANLTLAPLMGAPKPQASSIVSRVPVDKTKLSFPFDNGHIVNIELKKTFQLKREMVSGEEVKHPLPPSIRKGEFYMHNGKPIVPVDKDMAVWFKFELLTNGLPKVPYALKILVGGINVITGETEHGEQEVLTLENNQPNTQVGQNYLILPSQRWIDGFKTGNGTVRQFIVQEFGLNATVEEKLKGTQDGVIQFIAFPPTQAVIQQAKEEETIKLLTHIQNKKASFGPTYLFTGANITGATKGGGGGGVSKVGLAAGAQIVQDINVSTFPIDTFDPTRAQVFDLTLLDAHTFHELEGLPKPPRMPTQDEYDEICGWYYHLPVPASQRVEADPHSRLVAADQQGELTALPPVEMALPPVETALKFSIFGSSQENPPEEPTKPQDAPPSKGF